MRDVIEQLLAIKPFRPFRISLTSRTHQDIIDPAKAVVTSDVLRYEGNIFALDHVVSIEELPSASERSTARLIEESMRKYPETLRGLKRKPKK